VGKPSKAYARESRRKRAGQAGKKKDLFKNTRSSLQGRGVAIQNQNIPVSNKKRPIGGKATGATANSL